MKFTSKFWKGLQRDMGTTLHFSTTFHPQTDDQSERVIQILEDMLWSCVIEFKAEWEQHLSLVEFLYNNNFHSSNGMTPFETLNGGKRLPPVCWTEVREWKLLRPKLVQLTTARLS